MGINDRPSGLTGESNQTAAESPGETPTHGTSILARLDGKQQALVTQMLNEAGLLQDRVLSFKGMETATKESADRADRLAKVLERHAGHVHPARNDILSGVKFIATAAQREAEFEWTPEQRLAIEFSARADGHLFAVPNCTENWAFNAAKIALAAHVLAHEQPAPEANAIFSRTTEELRSMSRAMPNTVIGNSRL